MVLMILCSLVLLLTCAMKFSHAPALVDNMRQFGLEGYKINLIASLELLSAVMFLVPRTRYIGLLLVSGYLGGAMATHLEHNLSPVFPAFLLALFWIATFLCHPYIFARPCAMQRQLKDEAAATV
jgi:hypothetical protein